MAFMAVKPANETGVRGASLPPVMCENSYILLHTHTHTHKPSYDTVDLSQQYTFACCLPMATFATNTGCNTHTHIQTHELIISAKMVLTAT